MGNFSKMSDEELAIYIRDTDQEAYREIIVRFQKRLLRYVNFMVNDKNKAADIVQNTFIKSFINLNGFNQKMKFSTWIYRIAHNESINLILQHKKESPLLDNMILESEEDIEKDLDRKVIKELVKNCITELPLKYKEPLLLYIFEEKTYEEISDILRLPINTVGTRVNRAKLLVKKICQTKKI